MLGVPRSATDEQIKTAYRKLILKFHPDKNVGDTYFEDWSKKIIEAFEVLSNPQLRAEYDQVYDEHRQAAKKAFQEEQTAPAHEPEAAATEAAEAPVFTAAYDADSSEDVDYQYGTTDKGSHKGEESTIDDDSGMENMEAQALNYITARQDYLRAAKDFKAAQRQQPTVTSKAAFWPVIALCVLLIAGSIIWIVKNPWKERVEAIPEGRVSEMPARTFIVAAERAYFYKDPQNQVRTNEYLTRGMKVNVSRQYQNFYYGVFQSAANSSYKLTGWIKEEDLQQ